MSISPALHALRRAITIADETEPLLHVRLPLATTSTNRQLRGVSRGAMHAAAAATRHQRSHVALALRLLPDVRALGRQVTDGKTRLVALLVRESMRALDGDNLAGALKAVRDGVADALGIDDRNPRVTWLVDQRRGPAGVVIEVFRGAP